MCDHCRGQALLRSCPRAQLCKVHTDYPSCRQGTGAQTFGKALQRSSLQAAALGGASRRCQCSETFACRARWPHRIWCRRRWSSWRVPGAESAVASSAPTSISKRLWAPWCVLSAAWPQVLAPAPPQPSGCTRMTSAARPLCAALASTGTRRHSGAPPPRPGCGAEVFPAGVPTLRELWRGGACGWEKP